MTGVACKLEPGDSQVLRVFVSRALALAMVAVVVAAAARARAQEEPNASKAETVASAADLNQVRDLYRATDFAGCARVARDVLARVSSGDDSDAIDEARTYLAACLIRSGDVAGGDAVFEQGIRAALNENRLFPTPSTLVFPEAVIRRFDKVNARLEQERRRISDEKWRDRKRAEEEQRRDAELELERAWALYDLAAEERVTLKNRRWIAALPFGVGQFQNGERALGGLFLATEVLAVAGIVGGLSWQLELDARFHRREKDVESLDSVTRRRDTAQTLWVASLWSLLGLAGVGIVEAQLRFVPERSETRARSVPADLRPKKPRPAQGTRFAPTFVPAERGAVFGVSGRF